MAALSQVKNLKNYRSPGKASKKHEPVVGVLIGVDDSGRPLVDIEGSVVVARSTLSKNDCAAIQSFPVDVLVCFENGDRAKAVISGIVRDTLFPVGSEASGQNLQQAVVETEFKSREDKYHAKIDGKTIVLSARDEIKLECGKSSILLRKDGKIVIKGANLISRSSASNKIKGGSVSIN